MQEYTNRHNLPPEIVSILTKNRYNESNERLGDYSVTTLCSPIQQTILKRRYPEKLKVFDVIDLFPSFTGSIAHKVLEEHGSDSSLIEKRFYGTVLGKEISGQVDHYKDGIITDYKSTKVYKIMKNDYTDWEQQLNVYAWLARISGYTVNSIRIYTFILDWKKHEAYKKGYPKCPILEIPLRLWSKDECEKFIVHKIGLFIKNEQKKDSEIIECTAKEMWQDVKDWCIIKKGAKRATKCFDNKIEAEEYYHMQSFKEDFELVKRMTKRTRCFDHCVVSELCSQHKRLCIEEGGASIELQEHGEDCIF